MKRRKPGYFSSMEKIRGNLHTDQNNFQCNGWFSRYVIAAMLVDGKQKIAN